MRSYRFGLWSLAFVSVLLALSLVSVPTRAMAEDDECSASCKEAIHTCVRAGKAAFRSCKESCTGSEDRRACKRDCRPEMREAKEICRDAREGCREACEVEPPPPAECDHCRGELRECLHEVGSHGRVCTAECIGSRLSAVRECRRSPNPLACILEVTGDAASCLRGCSQAMHGGARACEAGHVGCRKTCEPGSPYGSASQAFLIPSPNLLQ